MSKIIYIMMIGICVCLMIFISFLMVRNHEVYEYRLDTMVVKGVDCFEQLPPYNDMLYKFWWIPLQEFGSEDCSIDLTRHEERQLKEICWRKFKETLDGHDRRVSYLNYPNLNETLTESIESCEVLNFVDSIGITCECELRSDYKTATGEGYGDVDYEIFNVEWNK